MAVEIHEPLRQGTQAHVGTSILDFGPSPNDYATVDVSGQTDIAESSHVRVWFQAETTMPDNTRDDHILAALFTRLTTSNPTPGVGFTVYCVSIIGRFSHALRVNWVWS
jgi:hypothetical protein